MITPPLALGTGLEATGLDGAGLTSTGLDVTGLDGTELDGAGLTGAELDGTGSATVLPVPLLPLGEPLLEEPSPLV